MQYATLNHVVKLQVCQHQNMNKSLEEYTLIIELISIKSKILFHA